jgi:hypothetical protein
MYSSAMFNVVMAAIIAATMTNNNSDVVLLLRYSHSYISERNKYAVIGHNAANQPVRMDNECICMAAKKP